MSPPCNSPRWRQRLPGRTESARFLPAVARSRRAHPHEAARMIHGIDEREHSKGNKVPRSHNALGYRTPLLEAIRGRSARYRARGAATCANESIPSPHHRVRTTPPERSIRFPCFSPPFTFFPRRVGLIPSGRVLLVWFSPSTLSSCRTSASGPSSSVGGWTEGPRCSGEPVCPYGRGRSLVGGCYGARLGLSSNPEGRRWSRSWPGRRSESLLLPGHSPDVNAS